MAYEVLERDEKGYATHTIENGVEDWIVNYSAQRIPALASSKASLAASYIS